MTPRARTIRVRDGVRRVAAVLAPLLLIGALLIALNFARSQPGAAFVAVAELLVVLIGLWYALTRHGIWRIIAVLALVTGLAAGIAYLIWARGVRDAVMFSACFALAA